MTRASARLRARSPSAVNRQLDAHLAAFKAIAEGKEPEAFREAWADASSGLKDAAASMVMTGLTWQASD